MTALALSPSILEHLLTAYPHIHHFVVAYSGGMDSHALLHLLAIQRTQWLERTLAAVYVDHGLQTASSAWGEHCRQVCRELGVAFQMLQVDARPLPGESPEAAARHARYQALAQELGPDAALLTAHHRDDQAETLLLQLLRGAGPHGLAAMPVAARLGQGWLLRPLLDVDRVRILAYARAQRLNWIEDTSNTDIGFDRNYLRHQILPLLRERWPAVNRALACSAQLCAETATWLDEEADADLIQLATHRPDCLQIPALREWTEQRQRNVLRRWLRRLGLPRPGSRHLQHILRDVLAAPRDRKPCVHWAGGEVRRYRDGLYAMPPLVPHDARQVILWQPDATSHPPLLFSRLGRLRLQATVGVGLRSTILSGATLIVRFRQGGERFRPVGRIHSQELKKLLQEAGIPPWERDRLPLLYRNDALLAVMGLGVAADWAAAPGETGWQPVWEALPGEVAPDA